MYQIKYHAANWAYIDIDYFTLYKLDISKDYTTINIIYAAKQYAYYV